MKRTVFILPCILLFVSLASSASAQFTHEELSQREIWEDFLKTAEIVKFEKVGEGVTEPTKLYLKKGDVEARAVWKNPQGIQKGFLEGWQYEIAAYRLDKLLGLNVVPPTVEREFKGKKGSLQLWVPAKYSLLKVMEENIPIPADAADRVNKMKYIARAWDSLIANDDRTQQNVLYTEDWRTILIDHSRAFRCDGEFVQRLIYGRKGIKLTADGHPFLFRQLPRALVEKIKALDAESLQSSLGSLLTDKEREAILIRKALLLAEVEEMIRESGENQVLYD